jgi:hypothetical protein
LELLSAVVHCIEFSYLVAEADALKQHLDLIATTRLLEIVLCNSKLCEGRREKEVDCFRLITIVLKKLGN